MTDLIRGDPVLMLKVQGELAAQAGHIRSRLTDLTGELDLLGELWEGEAESAYGRELRRALGRFSEVCTGLERLAAYEKHAAEVYEKCAKRTRQIITAVK